MANKTIETMKTAIVTGGSRGIGRNTALNLARRGADVIFTYHSNKSEAESLIREIEAMGRKAAGFRLDTGDVRSMYSPPTFARHCRGGDGASSTTS